MSLLPTRFSNFVATFGQSGEHGISTQCQSNPNLLVSWVCVVLIIGTLKIAPFHMYHATAVFNYRVHVMGAGNIWAMYQILARRYACTYRIR